MSELGNFGDFLDNTEVTDCFVNGKCSECGSCCTRFLTLSNKEINTIKAYIKRKGIKQQFHAVNVLATKALDLTCPFLDDTKPTHKCTIYEIRPSICRTFTCHGYINGFVLDMGTAKIHRETVDTRELFFSN